MLKIVASQRTRVKAVAIGGLNATNVRRIRYQTESPLDSVKLDGVAVVSALMSAPNPCLAARELREIFTNPPMFIQPQIWKPAKGLNINDIIPDITEILKAVQKQTPLVHHLTNDVSLITCHCLIV